MTKRSGTARNVGNRTRAVRQLTERAGTMVAAHGVKKTGNISFGTNIRKKRTVKRMPPHDIEYGMLTFAVTDKVGRPVTLTPAEYIEEPVNEKTHQFLLALRTGGEVTVTIRIRNTRGAIDCLTGFTFTKSARRFIRSQKRRAEKERRRRLKLESGME